MEVLVDSCCTQEWRTMTGMHLIKELLAADLCSNM